MDVVVNYTASADGTRIAYWRRGRGLTLVWMPALTSSHLVMELRSGRGAQFAALAEACEVVKYDGRGQGLSERYPASLSFASATEDLHAVIDSLGARRVALVATAEAGPVAIAFAASEPERVSHLILVDSFARSTGQIGTRLMQALLPVVAKDWELFTTIIMQARYGWAGGAEAAEEASILRGSVEPETFTRLVSAQVSFDATASLSKVSAPTLVLHNPRLSLMPSSDGALLASRIAGAIALNLGGHEDGYGIDETFAAVRQFIAPPSDGTASAQAEGLRGHLTMRESEILRLVANGRRNQEIALDLRISPHTIERHLSNIYVKLGAKSRVEAVTYALKHALLTRA